MEAKSAYAMVLPARNKDEAIKALLSRAEAGEIEFIIALEGVVTRCMRSPGSDDLLFAMAASEAVREQTDWQSIYADEKNWCGARTDFDDRAESVKRQADEIALARAKLGDQTAILYSDMQMAVGMPDSADACFTRDRIASGSVRP